MKKNKKEIYIPTKEELELELKREVYKQKYKNECRILCKKGMKEI